MGHTAYLDENDDPAGQSCASQHFKGINYMKTLKKFVEDHFKRSLANQLSGFEVVNIVESFIRINNERKCEGSPRDSAVKVSFMLLQEGFLRPISGGETTFNEDRRTFYRLGNKDEVQSVVILSHALNSRESSREREKPARRGSFSRILQSPLLRRGSVSRTSSKLTLDESSSSSSKSQKEGLIDDSESRLFEYALARLLTLIDLQILEELVEMQSHGGDELQQGSSDVTSLLTSILSKMGLWAEEEEGAEPVTIFLLKKHRRAEMVHNYFKSVRIMCPRMLIEENRNIDEYDQVELWGRQALKCVSNRLDSITRNGYSPLIPREFSKVVSAISVLPKEKLSEGLIYLCGMIPHKLRKELLLVIDFLSNCESTNLIFRLCDSRHCKMNTSDLGENLSHAIDTLRTFIIPQIGMDLDQQRYVISTLVENRVHLLNKVADLREEALSRCSPVPARFCEPVEEELATDRQLADLIVLILNDDRLSQPDKFKKLQLMQSQHPRAYAIYMKNLL